MDIKERTDSISGVPQGGLASPILFNIYILFEFNKFIETGLQKEINKINILQGPELKPRNNKYYLIDKEIQKNRKKYQRRKGNKKFLEIDPNIRNQMLTLLGRNKKLLLERSKTPSIDRDRRLIKIEYVRYADDWIIFSNCKMDVAKKLKDIIEKWLLVNLKLKLSPTKTKISDLRFEAAHFLGF